MTYLNIRKPVAVFIVSIFLAIPLIAQKSNFQPKSDAVNDSLGVTSSDSSGINSKEARKMAKLLRKLAGDWRYSNQVFLISNDGPAITIENVAFYYKCRLTGTSGRIWNGKIIGDKIRGTYTRTIRGKSFKHPFVAEVAKNGKSIILRYTEVIYMNPAGDIPGQFVKIPATDKLRRN